MSKIVLVLLFFFSLLYLSVKPVFATGFWQVQSIDTMKLSRDASRQPLSQDKIDGEIQRIAQSGATHVAIDTPYDPEFLPRLKMWVQSARKYKLNVWFRGNWSGWEGWFNYPKNLTRQQHLLLTKNFILDNTGLFIDGDIFTACPECENGGPGDPRSTGDVSGFRNFMISENEEAASTFTQINKQVKTNFVSMNKDVAKLIMNKDTTQKMGGLVSIDHYVPTPSQSIADAQEIASNSGGKIIFGEFGVPIPDLHGQMTETQQANWIKDFFTQAIDSPKIVGMNYWTDMDSSTALWNEDGSPRIAAAVIKSFYSPVQIKGRVVSDWGEPIQNATISFLGRTIATDGQGNFAVPYIQGRNFNLTITAANFESKNISQNNTNPNGFLEVDLKSTNNGFINLLGILYYRTWQLIKSTFSAN